VYRLFSEAQHEAMESEQLPEIARTSLANTTLCVKAMGLRHLQKLDWLDPPDSTSLRQAVRTLFLLGALDAEAGLSSRLRLTSDLGELDL
jgi:HrpA-like RNA helicase